MIRSEPTRSHVFSGRKDVVLNWEFDQEIARGSHSRIYRVINTETNDVCAAKVYDKAFLYRANLGDAEPPIQKAINEIQIMTMVKHPNCLGLREVLDDEYTNVIIIVQPYADCGSLVPQQSKMEPMPEEKARFYFFQIAMGVRHLHEHNIVHRDIKPGNFLIRANRTNPIVLVDFGLARQHIDPDTHEVIPARERCGFAGTSRYASHNAHVCKELGRRDDLISWWYSIIEMRKGHLPWGELRDKNSVYQAKTAEGVDEELSDRLPLVLRVCLALKC